MKALSFSEKEILTALLDKSKFQTIRPAWKIVKIKIGTTLEEVHKKYPEYIWLDRDCTKIIVPTQPRFKVGEQTQVMWKQRTSPKGSYFYRETGERYTGMPFATIPPEIGRENVEAKLFPKIMGTGEIMYAFKIEMLCDAVGNHIYYQYDGKWAEATFAETADYAYFDGFRSTPKPDGMTYEGRQKFWDFFHNTYDLSRRKPFWTYRWKWLP